jgi:hypothetical protein
MMNFDVFPNCIDYWGPPGLALVRNPQLRWAPIDSDTRYLAFAIENPRYDIDPGLIRQFDPTLGNNIRSDQKLPDFTGQIRFKGNWGQVLLGSVLRRIGYETLGAPSNVPRGFKVGWGYNLSGHFIFRERDKLILAWTQGHGIASYMNDGGVDLAADGTTGAPKPKAVPLVAATVYYEYYFAEHWGTVAGYSRTQVENTSLQLGDAFFRGEYASANLLYLPHKDLLFGGELLWGRRTDHNDATGEDIRVQISMRYGFSSR